MKSGMLHLKKAIADTKIPNLYGSDSEGEENGQGEGEGQQNLNENGEGHDEGDDGDEGGEGKESGKSSQERRDERARERANRLESENANLLKRLKEFEDANKSEIQKAQDDLAAEQKVNQELSDRLQQSRIENAFLADNTFDWHESRVALRLLDLSDVDIKDNGEVVGLAEAIKDLAESHPYLLKAKNKDDADKGKKNGPSGGSTNNSGGGGKEPTREQMAAKYPALRR